MVWVQYKAEKTAKCNVQEKPKMYMIPLQITIVVSIMYEKAYLMQVGQFCIIGASVSECIMGTMTSFQHKSINKKTC